MSKHLQIDQSTAQPASRMALGQRALRALMAVLPWAIDFQRNHATLSLIDTKTWKTNFAAKSDDFSLQALQKAGR